MKTKIMIINLGKQFGGVEKYVLNIIKHINKEKYDIHVCIRKDSLMRKSLEELSTKNINILEVKASKSTLFKDIIYIKKYIRENNISIVHNNGITSSIIGTLCGKLIKKVKILTTVHGFSKFDRIDSNYLIRFIFDKAENMVFKYNDSYIAVSKGIKSYLIKKGLNEDKIEVIYHGIDMEFNTDTKTEISKKGETITIGSVGRLELVKGYEHLIKAISYLRKENYDVDCILIGDGTQLERLKNLSEELEISNRVNFLGFKDNIIDLFDEIDIYVQPSIQEAFGISIIEAMNRGKFVVASNVGGIPEIIIHKKNGLLFDIKESDSLVESIKLFLDNKVDIDKIRQNAALSVREKFNITSSIEKLERVYDKLK